MWFVALGLFFCAAAIGGVRKKGLSLVDEPVKPDQSTALFVGVREFVEDDSLTEVQFAVDDAVDLAHLMSMERPLVSPTRVVLALSGVPHKEESRRRLAELYAAGAVIGEARHVDLLKLLRMQAENVGTNGLFIASFATHGINDEGTQHLLTASSLLVDRETALTETKIRDIVAEKKVPRALILIDACRERLTRDVRGGSASARSAAAKLMEEMANVHGQAVLSAAAANQYAYDYEGNGVFTAAVLDGLRCAAGTDENGFVTVETLSRFVESRVLSWIQRHRDPTVRRATQLLVEGRTARMPLSACGKVKGRR